MTYSTDTPIMGPSRGSAGAIYQWALKQGCERPAEVLSYLTTVYKLCSTHGMRAEFLVADSIHETSDVDTGAPWASYWWIQRLNPAGIGITGDDSQNKASRVFASGESAGRAHFLHMYLYAVGDNVPAGLSTSDDPRWDAAVSAGYAGIATTIDDLTNRWGMDDHYAAGIVKHLNVLESAGLLTDASSVLTTPPISSAPAPAKETTVVTTYQPKIIDKWLHVAQDGYAAVYKYIPNRNGNKQRIIFLHVQEGNNWGSWTWFHQVSASCTVMIAKNGDVWRVVPEEHGPWTNGDVSSPDAAMRAIMNRWGWDPNVYTLSIEHEGNSGGLPYTTAQKQSSVWQVQTWMQKYEIAAIYIMGHFQVNGDSRPDCPDPKDEGHPFVQSIRAAAAGVPVVVVPTEIYRDPWPVKTDAGVLWDGAKDVTVTTGPAPVTFYADKRAVTVSVDSLNGRQWASTTANLTPNAKTTGDTFDALGWVEGEEVEGERRWWVDTAGVRYWAGGTTETPAKAAPIPTTPDDPTPKPDYGNLLDKVPVVLNGNVYYPFDDREGDAGRGRKLKVVTAGDTYLWAGSDSDKRGTVAKDAEVWTSYWVRGEKIGDEDLWYVLDDGKEDPIRTGARVWAGLFGERPA